MNAIEEFATSFLSLKLHAVNILIWKKIPSLALFKIITASKSSTLLRIVLMRRSGCPTKGGNLGGLPASQKFWTFPFCWMPPQPKKMSPPVPWSHSIYWKKRYLQQLLDKFYQTFCLRHAFSVTQLWLIWKSSLELNPLIQNSVQQDYLPELYPIIPLNIYGKPWGWGRINPNSQKCAHFFHQKKSH